MTANGSTAAERGAARRLRGGAFVAAATAVVLLASAPPATAGPGAHEPATGWHEVVVTGDGAAAAATAVTAAGGRVLASLPLVHGVAARVPRGTDLGPRWQVAPQRDVTVAAAPGDATSGDAPVATLHETLGLPASDSAGRGVTVAVVDTGIADVPDLAGRVADRVDVTGTGPGDGYGHGTFMAGLIAGTGARSGGDYRGVAPGARLVDVKVADADGSTDLITVLTGLQWVATHARDVDVLNLSLSSYSPLPYQVDPLTQALEGLWRHGVTVVVPSGNDGPGAGTVTSPGSDPVLLTAGGLDESGSGARGDDTVGEWSGRGPSWQGDAKPDLVAPGAHLVGLRAPGSAIDAAHPGSRVGDGYFKGTGTSMATAVTAGVAAVVLAAQPRLRPDAVKSLLTGTAYGAPGLTAAGGAGAGALDASAALAAAPRWRATPAPDRADPVAAVLRGDARTWSALAGAFVDDDRAAAAAAWRKLSAASREWAGRAWAELDPATRSWAETTWEGRAWASGPDGTAQEWVGRAWAADAWVGRAWADFAWEGRAWAENDWTGRAWADFAWEGRAWAGRAWAGRAWADFAWEGRAWAGRAWADAAWTENDWTGRAWAENEWTGRAWAWLP